MANLANTKWCKKYEKWLKPLHTITHMRVLGESFPISTNMTGLGGFSEILRSSALDKSILSIGRANDNSEVHWGLNSDTGQVSMH